MRVLTVLILLMAFTQNGISQNYIGKQKEIDQILKNIENFSSYVMNADYEKIAESYTVDGKIFPNNKEIIEGRDSIMDYWRLPEGVQTTYHKIIPSEIKIIGKEAYDYGYYEGKTKRKNGEEVSWRGKYIIIWKKVDKEWKIYLDIWNAVAN